MLPAAPGTNPGMPRRSSSPALPWAVLRAARDIPAAPSAGGEPRMRELSGMQREHREALRSSHLLLAKQLVPGEVCQHLLAQRVLTEEMLELIEAKSGPFSRNVELLRLLPKRGPSAFDAFCQALRDTEQGHLVALLHQHLTPGPDVAPSQTPRTLEAAPGDGEREGASSTKKPRRSDTAETSLDDGDGPLSCSVLPCSAEFYQRHRETSYRMDSRPKGLAMIISNVRFGGAQELVDRQGGEVDHWALEKLLTSLGFSVRSLHDQAAEVMKSELLQFARLPDHRSNHSCVVALLSHGVEGAVYGSDGKLLQLQDVFRLFDNDSCPQLQNKPKIFFIQACRGGESTLPHSSLPVSSPSL
ncbi:caspase-2-like [Mobula hypostoma]|uniref:caspase-2-like n=1 Tax=Mobula hypostoma TaxID=723540 RepID=UPI002FC37D5F